MQSAAGGLRDLPIDLHPLDAAHVLALIACDAGADNVSSIVLVGTGAPGARSFQYGRFDFMPGFAGDARRTPDDRQRAMESGAWIAVQLRARTTAGRLRD